MGRMEDWPSYKREMSGWEPAAARVRSGQPIRLPNLPNLDRFYEEQSTAMAEAIARGRVRRAEHGGQGFGYNRQYKSRIEARIEWWRHAVSGAARPTHESTRAWGGRQVVYDDCRTVSEYAQSTRHAIDVHVEPDWDQIAADLSALSASVAVELVRSFDATFGALALSALHGWPVASGMSSAMIGVDLSPGLSADELLRASVYAGAGYSGYIEREGYRVKSEKYVNKKGETKWRKKRVRSEGLVPSKAQYLVKSAGGKWAFDADAYERDKAGADPWRKRAKGKPWQDLFLRPAPAAVSAMGKAAVEAATKGTP